MKADFLQQHFPQPDHAELLARLKRPVYPVDVIIDTDAYNEIDDQYALAYALRSDEKLRIKAITAAPFYRAPAPGKIIRSSSPADGMERSYEEIFKVLELLGRADMAPNVYRGATQYLPTEAEAVSSEAVCQIINLSQNYSKEHPLYIIAIGAITNIASALLIDPTLTERVVLIWLGGHAHHWEDCNEFNLAQDIAAARVVFGCGVPLVQLPCQGVVSEFRFSKPELEYWFRDKNPLCNYLIDNTYAFAAQKFAYEGWSKPLWDVTTVAWLLDPGFVRDRFVPSPVPEYDATYGVDLNRHPIRYVYAIKKDEIIADMAEKLGRHS